jgi:hypothetical protein
MEDTSVYDSSLYDSSTAIGSGSDAAAAGVMFGILGFITILSYVVTSLFMGMMFKKAGIPAWKAWVPVYNAWTFLEMGDQKGWISLLLLLSWIPLLGFIPAIVAAVFMCIAAYRIGLNFGKEAWFVVLYILISPVWLIWLAVDKTAVWKPATTGSVPEAAPTQPEQTQQPATTQDDTTPPSTPSQPSAM